MQLRSPNMPSFKFFFTAVFAFVTLEMKNMFFSMFPGRKFDKNGELIEKRTQWSEPAIKMFQEKAKCLVEQFSQYKVLNKFHVSSKRDYLPAFKWYV